MCVPGPEVAMLLISTRTAFKVIEKKKKDTTADCDPRAWKDIQMVFIQEGDSGGVDAVS